MHGINIHSNERASIGEALLVYLHRALGKPSKTAYFHTRLLDVLLKCAADTYRISLGITWARNTSFLKHFDRRSPLDDHPDAPEWAASQVFGKGAAFVALSPEGIARIKGMSRERRRQLEAIACELFPDHEAIAGDEELYSGATLPEKGEGYLTSEDERHVRLERRAGALEKSWVPLDRLEANIAAVLHDAVLSRSQIDNLRSELEDLLIGRLELEQPMINVEMLARVLVRALKRVSAAASSTAMENLAQRAIAGLALYFPIFAYATAV